MSRCGSLPAVSGASPEGGNAPLWVVTHRGASGHAPENTMAAFRHAGQAARTVVLSFDAPTLAAVRRLDPTLMTGLLAEVPHANLIERATLVGARQLALRGDLVTPERLAEARRHDLQVVTWPINHPAHMQALMEAGVDGIFTDYPDRLLAVHRR